MAGSYCLHWSEHLEDTCTGITLAVNQAHARLHPIGIQPVCMEHYSAIYRVI